MATRDKIISILAEEFKCNFYHVEFLNGLEIQVGPKGNVVEFLIEHMTPKIKDKNFRQLAVVKGLIIGQPNINGNVILQLPGTLRERWLCPLSLPHCFC